MTVERSAYQPASQLASLLLPTDRAFHPKIVCLFYIFRNSVSYLMVQATLMCKVLQQNVFKDFFDSLYGGFLCKHSMWPG